MVPSAVSYGVKQHGNARSKAPGQGTHRHPTGTTTVRRRCLCRHPAERGRDGGSGAHRWPLEKRCHQEQAKEADRLGPPRHRSGARVCGLPWHGHPTLPADRAHRTRPCQPGGTWQARTAPAAQKAGKPSGPLQRLSLSRAVGVCAQARGYAIMCPGPQCLSLPVHLPGSPDDE